MVFHRFLFYILAGFMFALLGLIFGQFVIVSFLPILKPTDFYKEYLTNVPPDLILLPIIAGLLAFAMVGVEIYSSRPTRHKLKSFQRILPPYLSSAFLAGLITGLLSALLSWFLYITDIPSSGVRVCAWTLIGLLIGLGESISWRFRSSEGQTSKANSRLIKSITSGFVAGLLAAILIEIIRGSLDLKEWEDVIGFSLLGVVLGACLSIGTSYSYQGALRAGKGFEFYEKQPDKHLPKLSNQSLRFVTEDTEEDEEMIIEEGLSIQLPPKLEKPLMIGSQEGADIYIPHLPEKCASLSYKDGKYILKCLTENKVRVNEDPKIKGDTVTLRHNHIISFYHADNDQQFYNFVFYDRFLDPQV